MTKFATSVVSAVALFVGGGDDRVDDHIHTLEDSRPNARRAAAPALADATDSEAPVARAFRPSEHRGWIVQKESW